ncbi:hypothetical protein AN958_08440 [Leucoagaricus sp. SymC.cos]|nr:hypothetical protein AN958_08440 [Leucoagaricus sp. SymC.cos]
MSCEAVSTCRITWDPELTINMQSANRQITKTYSLAKNILFNFGNVTIHLQVHVMEQAPYRVLIMDIPFSITIDEASMAIANSGLDINLAAKPRMACNSTASDTATIWFDVWDSQTGVLAKKLQKEYLSIGNAQCIIQLAKARPSTPQCQ